MRSDGDDARAMRWQARKIEPPMPKAGFDEFSIRRILGIGLPLAGLSPAHRCFSMRFAFLALLLCPLVLLTSAPAAAQPEPPSAQTQRAPGDTLTLPEALDLAAANNYQLRQAATDAAIAANDVSLGNARFLPRLSFTAQQNRRPTGGFSLGGSDSGTFGGGNSFTTAANLNWTVFDGFSRFAEYDRLNALSRQTTLDAQRTAEVALADVIVQYYDVARQQQQIDVFEEAVAISEERLRIAELRLDLGSASELAVRQARIDLNEDRAALLQQRSSIANAKAALNRLLGRPADPAFAVRETIDLTANFDAEQLLTEARQHNRALRAAQAARVAAVEERRIAQSDWLPRLDLTAGYAFNNVTTDFGLPSNQPGGFSYGLSASFDLFTGFNRPRQIENARLHIRRRDLEIQEIETRVETAARSALENYRNALARIELEQENLEAARLNVEVALKRFRLGTFTSIELREVQQTLTEIQRRLLSARFDAKQAETDLLLLSGRLLPRTDRLGE